MNKHKSELLFIGGGMLLAPIAGCALGLTLYLITKMAVCSILLGTVMSMAIYLGGCWIHINRHGLPDGEAMTPEQKRPKQTASTSK